MIKKIVLTSLFSICITYIHAQDIGNATFYSNKLHGHRTADGGIYHKDSMTCAHKTYPFGTLLKVKDTHNAKEVIVKVTDRGPFGKRLIIDLSYRAAKELGIIRRGVAPVEVSIFEPIHASDKPLCDLQTCNILHLLDTHISYPLPFHKE